MDVFDHRHAAIVEDQPAAIEARRHHGMRLTDVRGDVRPADGGLAPGRRLRAAPDTLAIAKSSQSPGPEENVVSGAGPDVGRGMLKPVACVGD